MFGVVLFALFSAVAVATATVLADCFLRGRDAFARLRRELAQAEAGGRIVVTIEQFVQQKVVPAPRLQLVSRAEPRCRAAIRRQPLAAAA